MTLGLAPTDDAPRNYREAHAELEQADLRHLHRRASIPAYWRHDRRPVAASLTPQGRRWARWILAALVTFWLTVWWLS